jgi:hypothetical protein
VFLFDVLLYFGVLVNQKKLERMDGGITVCKIMVVIGASSVPKPFFVTGYWSKFSFKVELTDGRSVWSADVSEEKIKKDMCPREADRAAFFALLKESLSSQAAASEKFPYALTVCANKTDMLLEWKVCLSDEDKMHLKMQILFKPYPAETHKEHMQRLLSWLMEQEHSSSALVASQKMRFSDMESDLQKSLVAIQRMSETKDKMELQLFEKFSLVLNRKKDKIVELEAKVAALMDSLPSPVKKEPLSVVASSAAANKSPRKGAEKSDSDSDLKRPRDSDLRSVSPTTAKAAPRKRVRAVAAAPPVQSVPTSNPAAAKRRINRKEETRTSPVAPSPSPSVVAKPKPHSTSAGASADPMALIQGFD